MNPLNDKDILRRISLKEDEAFENLYREHYKKLFLISFSYTKNQETSEEVVHDVFLKIWNQSSTLNITQSLNAYLAKAVINTSLNAIKKNKRLKEQLDDYNTDDFFSAIAEDVSEHAEETEKALLVLERAIEMLPPQCKKILQMSKFEKLKQQEIAETLNISIKTVKNHLTYAYKKLKEVVGTELMTVALFIFYIGLLDLKFV